MDFVGLEWETMPRFVTTRWLCLGKCCEKELRQYEAFKSMFESRTGDSSKQDRGNGNEAVRIQGFSDLKWLLQIHLSFFNAALPLFTHFNAFFAEKLTTFTP